MLFSYRSILSSGTSQITSHPPRHWRQTFLVVTSYTIVYYLVGDFQQTSTTSYCLVIRPCSGLNVHRYSHCRNWANIVPPITDAYGNVLGVQAPF